MMIVAFEDQLYVDTCGRKFQDLSPEPKCGSAEVGPSNARNHSSEVGHNEKVLIEASRKKVEKIKCFETNAEKEYKQLLTIF